MYYLAGQNPQQIVHPQTTKNISSQNMKMLSSNYINSNLDTNQAMVMTNSGHSSQ
jgi:hypothetical protein